MFYLNAFFVFLFGHLQNCQAGTRQYVHVHTCKCCNELLRLKVLVSFRTGAISVEPSNIHALGTLHTLQTAALSQIKASFTHIPSAVSVNGSTFTTAAMATASSNTCKDSATSSATSRFSLTNVYAAAATAAAFAALWTAWGLSPALVTALAEEARPASPSQSSSDHNHGPTSGGSSLHEKRRMAQVGDPLWLAQVGATLC
jgi:hypothetical protein